MNDYNFIDVFEDAWTLFSVMDRTEEIMDTYRNIYNNPGTPMFTDMTVKDAARVIEKDRDWMVGSMIHKMFFSEAKEKLSVFMMFKSSYNFMQFTHFRRAE